MRQLRLLICGALLAVASATFPAMAQEPLTTNRATELRSAPEDGATVVKQLAEKAPLQLLERKGAWSRVKSGNDAGWVRRLHEALRTGITAEAAVERVQNNARARLQRRMGLARPRFQRRCPGLGRGFVVVAAVAR